MHTQNEQLHQRLAKSEASKILQGKAFAPDSQSAKTAWENAKAGKPIGFITSATAKAALSEAAGELSKISCELQQVKSRTTLTATKPRASSQPRKAPEMATPPPSLSGTARVSEAFRKQEEARKSPPTHSSENHLTGLARVADAFKRDSK